jgi:hypothetical protein
VATQHTGDRVKKTAAPAGSVARKKERGRRQTTKKGRKNGIISMKKVISVLLLLSLLFVTFGAVGYIIFFRTPPA